MSAVGQAIILAAGEGVRLRPITFTTPKPLVPFYGRPLIDWAIDKVRSAGVTRIAVNTCHLGDQIAAYLAGSDIHVRRETTLLGTGGAVRNLRDWLTPGEPFYVLNADAVFAADPRELVHAPSLLVTREPRYANERRIIGTAGRFERLDERSDPAGYTFCGLTLADPGLPSRLPDGPSCILRQGFVPYLDALAVRLVETHAFFADTGTPEALVDAHIRGQAWVRVHPGLTCRGTSPARP